VGRQLHEGVVEFRTVSAVCKTIMLGRVEIGEISRTVMLDPRSHFTACFRIDLPGLSSKAWHPARGFVDAERQASQRINDWLNAAGLRPIGGS